uniref:Putative pancreatic lipase-like enzyme n=1 Tax=Ixodes ricinus TaxID=34613 RepID=V5ICT4_IXORI
MRNLVALILAVSGKHLPQLGSDVHDLLSTHVPGVFFFDQGHSFYQDSSESSGIAVTTPVNIEGDTSASRSRGGPLISKYRNQNFVLNSEVMRFKDRINRTRRSPGDISAIYEVYTNRKRNGTSDYYYPAIIARHVDDFPSIAALLDPDQKLYLLVHGWLGSSASFSSISSSSSSSRKVKDEELADIKNELLRVENATVIVVDWFEKAKNIYSDAKRSARYMAYGMAWLVKTLVEAGALNVSKVHYIGHSLGAQAAGYFAQSLKLILNGQKIGRITGLDPANKDFEGEHLDTDDADFVDVIHTSNGILQLGMRDPIGHVDFYPDGGGRQSGCYAVGCSHKRAKIYYLMSIDTCKYPSRCCPSGAYTSWLKMKCSRWQTFCGRMGHHASSDLRGVHYLEMDSDYPHCGS